VNTLFAEPVTASQAAFIARVVERARTLFTAGGYTWHIADDDPCLFGVCGPQGQCYVVHMKENTCSCRGFEKYRDCKHRIAIANDPECEVAAMVKRLEFENQWWVDAGFSERPLYL
jgi:hypothetical protein